MLDVGPYDEHREAWPMRRRYNGRRIDLLHGATSLDDVAEHAAALRLARDEVAFAPGVFAELRLLTDGPSSGWSEDAR